MFLLNSVLFLRVSSAKFESFFCNTKTYGRGGGGGGG